MKKKTTKPAPQTVKSFMKRSLVTIGPDENLHEALDLMTKNAVRHILVIKDGKLAGVVTDRDLRFALPSRLVDLDPVKRKDFMETVTVDKICIKNPYTATPDMPVRDAAIFMRQRKIGCLPVLEKGELTGIITVTDLIEAFIEMTGD